MIQYYLRKSEERGQADFGWLKSRHTFSFGEYHDPRFVGFGDLVVINEDWVAPGTGFPTHPHRDMEIITYVISGALEHQDSLGHRAQILPGEIQRMTAGRGIRHSEYNASKTEELHLLQIWIHSDAKGHDPGYEQKKIDLALAGKDWLRLASKSGGSQEVAFHQDASVFTLRVEGSLERPFPLQTGRKGWLQVITGSVEIDFGDSGPVVMGPGDGLALVATDVDLPVLSGRWSPGSHALFFDLRA